MRHKRFQIHKQFSVKHENVSYNPGHDFFKKTLRPYYVITADRQYLFASTQPGRRPDCAFYMVPEGYKLGKGQKKFDRKIGKKLFSVVRDYLKTVPLLVQDGIQGEIGYKVGLRITTSMKNPHSGYLGWMGKMMIFPKERGMNFHCFNYIIPEPLPLEYIQRILEFWPDYDPSEPLTLYDLTDADNDFRQVVSLGVDYFGGAFKKPNLTMVWNRAESDGLISYHAGCTGDRILKGLSGTGKTTLTVGKNLEQDDAVVGLPLYDREGKVGALELIGLEAASFAKSEGLNHNSPEWEGLMKSSEPGEDGEENIVLAMNIDCENVDFRLKELHGFEVKVPVGKKGKKPGKLLPTSYEKSRTTNGRFIFKFGELNPKWGYNRLKILRTEALGFKRYDMVEPIIRIIDPVMAVALDSACESIITSAVGGKKAGTRVRSYAATDFMAREESEQARLKLKIYSDLGLGVDGKLVFIVNNAGYVGEHDFLGNQIVRRDSENNPIPKRHEKTGEPMKNLQGEPIYEGQGEKIKVEDSKKLMKLVEGRKIRNWIKNPIFGYLVPDPRELEIQHGMKNFRARFNPLNYYTPEQIIDFAERDIRERTEFLEELFRGQKGYSRIREVVESWRKIKIPGTEDIKRYYDSLYREQ